MQSSSTNPGFVAAAACLAVLCCGVTIPTPSLADPLFVGSEFQINTYTTSFQYGVYGGSVARSANGSFVVVWSSNDQDGDGNGIFGQRFDAGGTPSGTEFQVNTYTTGAQFRPSVSIAADGSFVVAWSSALDGSYQSVHGQRYDATGAPDGTEFQVNTYTTSDQREPSVSSASDGSFVVVWQSYGQDGSAWSVQGQRYDATGAADGTEFQVNSFTTAYQQRPAVSSAADGSFVVVWMSYGADGSGESIRGQRYDAAGAPEGTEFQVNTFTISFQYFPRVSSASDGSFVVVWASCCLDGDSFSIQGQRYDATGAVEGTEFQANSYTTFSQTHPAVAVDTDGSFLVAWRSQGQDGSFRSIHGQHYDATGAADGAEFQINSYTTNYQRRVSVSSDGAGNFVVVWDSTGQDGDNTGRFGQLLCADVNTNLVCDSEEPTTSTTTTTTAITTTTTFTTTTLPPPPMECGASPTLVCSSAAQAKLDFNEKKAGNEKMKVQWKKLADATMQGDFGDPVGGNTSVAICVYNDADALVQDYIVDRSGDTCAGKACWKAKGTKGYGYKDKDASADGVVKLGFKSGDAGKGKADTKGGNKASKGQTSLPIGIAAALAGNVAPTIQMVTSDGFCATATMNTVKKDETTRYSAQLK